MPTILLIDDNEDFRETLGELLEMEGYQVIEAADGKEGTDLYKKNVIDLVVTDLIMPKQDGIKTILELKEDDPRLSKSRNINIFKERIQEVGFIFNPQKLTV